jgi:hypothetical protein
MKLLCCVRCNELFSLSHTYKQCLGGHCGGQYVGNVDARMWGNRREVFGIGFANSSFSDALSMQLNNGDLPKTMRYAGGVVSPGRDFKAFVMPDDTPSIKWVESKAEYDAL